MTFEPGTGAPQWMITIGLLHGGRAVLELLRPVRGDFLNSKAASELQSWGDAELVSQSCTRARGPSHSSHRRERGRVPLFE